MKLWTPALLALVLLCGGTSIASAQTGALLVPPPLPTCDEGDPLVWDDEEEAFVCGTIGEILQPLSDGTAIVKDNSDATKLLAFQLSGLSPATTRTWTVPDADLTIPSTIASLAANTFTGLQTLSAGLSATTGTFSSTLAVAGDVSVNTDKFTVDGATGNTAIAGSLAVSAQTTITGNLLPGANATYALGSSAAQWSEAWLSGDLRVSSIKGLPSTVLDFGGGGTTHWRVATTGAMSALGAYNFSTTGAVSASSLAATSASGVIVPSGGLMQFSGRSYFSAPGIGSVRVNDAGNMNTFDIALSDTATTMTTEAGSTLNLIVGKVGIGTTTPTWGLHVVGTDGFTGIAAVRRYGGVPQIIMERWGGTPAEPTAVTAAGNQVGEIGAYTLVDAEEGTQLDPAYVRFHLDGTCALPSTCPGRWSVYTRPASGGAAVSRFAIAQDGHLALGNYTGAFGAGAIPEAVMLGPLEDGSAMHVTLLQNDAPTCTANCGTDPAVVGSDSAMTVTLGTGSPTSGFVITFDEAWQAAPSCIATPATSGTTKYVTAVVTTTTTVTVDTAAAPAAEDQYHIVCFGVQGTSAP